MSFDYQPDPDFERHVSARLLDVLIRAGMMLALVMMCYQIFSPFVSLMVWAVILAVSLYPLHQMLTARMRGRRIWASVLLVLVTFVVIVVPCAMLAASLADSVTTLVHNTQGDELRIPPPWPGIEEWPVVGKQLHAYWYKAHTDLASLLGGMKPEIIAFVKKLLGSAASMGLGLLMFFSAFIVAGVIMAYGAGGHSASRAIFSRIAGYKRGEEFVVLSTATIRAVAQGVIGVALIQAIITGLALLAADVPWAGALAMLTLVIAIAQIPAGIVTLPAIVYIWMSGEHGTFAAVIYTAILLVVGVLDNILKPLLLGRGVNAPMPVVLMGALGGMVTAGILGMFVGAVLLTLGYQIFMHWVNNNPDSANAPASALLSAQDESQMTLP